MKYVSTRGDKTERGFSEILLEGLAPDGGLYLPAHYPQIDATTLARWRGLSYAELAFEIRPLVVAGHRIVASVESIAPRHPGEGLPCAPRVRSHLFTASDEANFHPGVSLPVDGGTSVRVGRSG